ARKHGECGGDVPREQDQGADQEKREARTHGEAGRLRARLLRIAVAAAAAACRLRSGPAPTAWAGLAAELAAKQSHVRRFCHRTNIGGSFFESMDRKLAQAGLIVLMVLGGLMLWLGNPVIWLWIGSH